MPTVPVDGRAQYDLATLLMAGHALGRLPFADVETVTPGGSYILKNSWPASSRVKFDGPPTAPAPNAAPKTSTRAARAIWPDLK
jgi:hypothetical protein